MENNENFEAVETSENVEQTTEETVVEPAKMFTQDELNAAVGKAKARERAKVTRQFQRKYGGLEEVLRAGTGKETVEEMTDSFKQFYQEKGVQFSEKPAYSASDIALLAQADADEIIRGGYDEVVEEVDRLADIGTANMTPREKATFKVLADYRNGADRSRELAKLGVTEDVYESEAFKNFAGKFNPRTPIADIYDIYDKTQPKKDIKPMGSMKQSAAADNGVKDFYTFEEASKFTKADFDRNPALFDAVRKSMTKWK